jgi:YbgC/YbaW family acyl-CoA thioester hydrolase
VAAVWETTVRWGETDAAGFVFYPTYFAWFDEATHHFLNTAGLSSVDLFSRERIGFPILEAKANFKAPLYFGDSIRVTTELQSMGRKTFTVAHRIWRDDICAAEGYEVRGWVRFGTDSAHAELIPDAARERLGAVAGP